MKFALPLLAAAASLALASSADAQRTKRPARPPAKAAPAKPPEPVALAPDIDSLLEDSAQADTPPASEVPPAEPAAAEPAVTEPAAVEPAPTPVTVKLPPPEFTPGVKRRYRIVSIEETKRPDGTRSRSNEQLVEIEVLEPEGAGRRLRYVIVQGAVKNDPLGDAMLAASKGVATDYEADASGKPLKLVAWEQVRATILERLLLDPSAPLEGAKRARTALTSMDGVSAVRFAVPEVAMMADMQAWPELPIGRTDDPPRVSGAGNLEARLTSYREAKGPAEGGCIAELRGATELDPQSPAAKSRAAVEKLETTAEISTIDGWVVSLKQVRTQLVGSNREVRSWTITREDLPACPDPAPTS